MSHIVFGECNATNKAIELFREKISQINNNEILFWSGDGVNSHSEIHQMINENGGRKGNHIFYFTTINQPPNSDGLLFPYEKYSQKELFPDNNDRIFFEKKCQEVLSKFIEIIEIMLYTTDIDNIRIFIAEGYDNEFNEKKCTTNEMMKHLLQEIKTSFSIDSVIYKLYKLDNMVYPKIDSTKEIINIKKVK